MVNFLCWLSLTTFLSSFLIFFNMFFFFQVVNDLRQYCLKKLMIAIILTT